MITLLKATKRKVRRKRQRQVLVVAEGNEREEEEVRRPLQSAQRGAQRVDKEVHGVVVLHVGAVEVVQIGGFEKVPAVEPITQEEEEEKGGGTHDGEAQRSAKRPGSPTAKPHQRQREDDWVDAEVNRNAVDDGCGEETVLLKEQEQEEQEETLDTVAAAAGGNHNHQRVEQPDRCVLLRRLTAQPSSAKESVDAHATRNVEEREEALPERRKEKTVGKHHVRSILHVQSSQ